MTPSSTKLKFNNSKVLLAVKKVKAPVACFSAKPTTGKAEIVVQFTDKSANSSTSWYWDFGDGTTLTAQNPSHKYNKVGKHTVSRTVKEDGGSNTKKIQNFICFLKSGYYQAAVYQKFCKF